MNFELIAPFHQRAFWSMQKTLADKTKTIMRRDTSGSVQQTTAGVHNARQGCRSHTGCRKRVDKKQRGSLVFPPLPLN